MAQSALSRVLQSELIRRGWSAGDLARAAGGMTREAARLYVNGEREPGYLNLRRLAEGLGWTLGHLDLLVRREEQALEQGPAGK